MPPECPARIGPYDVVGVIGSGRLGTVYKAFDEGHARVVGIRVLSPDLLADAPRLERFRRAARAGAPPAGSVASVKKAATAPRKQVPREAPAAPDPEQAAGALFTEAPALIKGNQDLEARTKLASIGERYSQSRWFVPAMMVKIDIEDRRTLREFDPVIGMVAPASVQTKRLLTQRAPQHPTAEAALWQLGGSYDDMKQYALAVQAYVQLATRFPNTRLDAWFKAGEITERRLKNRDDARAAYLRVPPTSARYQDAQDRAKKLAGR